MALEPRFKRLLLFPGFLDRLDLSSFFFLAGRGVAVVVPADEVVGRVVTATVVIFSGRRGKSIRRCLLFMFAMGGRCTDPPGPEIIEVCPVAMVACYLLVGFFECRTSLVRLWRCMVRGTERGWCTFFIWVTCGDGVWYGAKTILTVGGFGVPRVPRAADGDVQFPGSIVSRIRSILINASYAFSTFIIRTMEMTLRGLGRRSTRSRWAVAPCSDR